MGWLMSLWPHCSHEGTSPTHLAAQTGGEGRGLSVEPGWARVSDARGQEDRWLPSRGSSNLPGAASLAKGGGQASRLAFFPSGGGRLPSHHPGLNASRPRAGREFQLPEATALQGWQRRKGVKVPRIPL